MNWLSLDASLFVHAASLLYVLGFLIRDQVWLRALVLIGTGCYIAYYYLEPTVPLWDAIAWSSVLGLANAFVMFQIILERTTLALSHEQRELYKNLHTLSPGEFRRLLKISHWSTCEDTTILARENQPLDVLHYVLEGTVVIEKRGRRFSFRPRTFIGEVAYFLRKNATATVCVGDSARVISWHREELQELERRSPGIRIALQSVLTNDMAEKIAIN